MVAFTRHSRDFLFFWSKTVLFLSKKRAETHSNILPSERIECLQKRKTFTRMKPGSLSKFKLEEGDGDIATLLNFLKSFWKCKPHTIWFVD
jgi:hypothetical protein